MEIKNRYTGEVIFECEARNIKEAVEKAVKQGADLMRADLREADLNETDLWRTNFYKTKIIEEQKEQIINSDLFDVEEIRN